MAVDQHNPELHGSVHAPAQPAPSSCSSASPATLLQQEERDSNSCSLYIIPTIHIWKSIPKSKEGFEQSSHLMAFPGSIPSSLATEILMQLSCRGQAPAPAPSALLQNPACSLAFPRFLCPIISVGTCVPQQSGTQRDGCWSRLAQVGVLPAVLDSPTPFPQGISFPGSALLAKCKCHRSWDHPQDWGQGLTLTSSISSQRMWFPRSRWLGGGMPSALAQSWLLSWWVQGTAHPSDPRQETQGPHGGQGLAGSVLATLCPFAASQALRKQRVNSSHVK